MLFVLRIITASLLSALTLYALHLTNLLDSGANLAAAGGFVFGAIILAYLFEPALVSLTLSLTQPKANTTGASDSTKAGKKAQKPKAAKKSAKPASKTASSGARETGEVKWFNVSKGYGFITRENGEDIFVHFRSIQSTGRDDGRRGLAQSQKVEFELTDGDKGPQAENVVGL